VDEDLVDVGHYSQEWLSPTAGLRFIERDGVRVLQQKWQATAKEMIDGREIVSITERWKDIPFEPNPRED
jgi:hypothetical protein